MLPQSKKSHADRPRLLTEADCHDVAQRLQRFAADDGSTNVAIVSTWTGNVRWARNRITTTGERHDNHVLIARDFRGARAQLYINDISDVGLVAAARRSERLARLEKEHAQYDVLTRPDSPFRYHDEPVAMPQLFYQSTYEVTTAQQAELAIQLAKSAADASVLSAGYLEVAATSMAHITSWGYSRFYQYTWAQQSITVRDPKGIGSGWAGVDRPDWSKIDGPSLAGIALDKCLKSRNPVAVEPGRYMTILEPQAVCDFIGNLMFGAAMDRNDNEGAANWPFHRRGQIVPRPYSGREFSLLGQKIIDERITISADPMDPELGFLPFDVLLDFKAAYHPATWIEHGVLKTEAYNRNYGVTELGQATGLPNAGAFRMSGGPTTIDEMIATTKRGLLVTRFDQVQLLEITNLLHRGYTRDGLWLIENGKITKPVKNMVFTESVLFALNKVTQLGPPQRVFHPQPYWWSNPQPAIVPPLQIDDFSFTALTDAI